MRDKKIIIRDSNIQVGNTAGGDIHAETGGNPPALALVDDLTRVFNKLDGRGQVELMNSAYKIEDRFDKKNEEK